MAALLALLCVLAGPSRAAPKVGASQILGAAQDALRPLPGGEGLLRGLDERHATLSITSAQSLGQEGRFASRWSAPKNTVYFSLEVLDSGYSELEAAGVLEPAKIGADLGLKLAPSLAHEACHVRLSAELSLLAGSAVPDSVEEEALCLGAELEVLRGLWRTQPWRMGRSRIELDRLEDRVAWLLLGEHGPLAARAAAHYPSLLSFSDDRLLSLSRFYARKQSPFSLLAVNRARFESALDELEKAIRRGGAGLLKSQEDYAKNEVLSQRSQELSLDRSPREGGDGQCLVRPAAYSAVQAFLKERLDKAQAELASPHWRRWAEEHYPEWSYAQAVRPEDRRRWGQAAALKQARLAGDLLSEGNPYYLRGARKAAKEAGLDIQAAEREAAALEEAKIRRQLDTAETLAGRGDEGSRKWSLRLLRRAGLEGREVWDMPPYWLTHRQEEVFRLLQKPAP